MGLSHREERTLPFSEPENLPGEKVKLSGED